MQGPKARMEAAGVEEQKGVRQGEKDNVREKEEILEKQGDKY